MKPKSEIQGFDVSSLCVAVLGCGGLGCNIAVHLAGMGVKKIYLIDFDTVSQSNLNRQFLYAYEDIGKNKAVLAAQKLSAYAPQTEVIAINRKIGCAADLDEIKNADMIFSAADNVDARSVLQFFCKENGIPLVNGGINGFFGTVYLYVPGQSPCLDCAGLLKKESGKTVSVSSTAGIIGALEVQTGIQYFICSEAYEPGRLHIFDAGEIHILKIKSQKNCEICGVTQ